MREEDRLCAKSDLLAIRGNWIRLWPSVTDFGPTLISRFWPIPGIQTRERVGAPKGGAKCDRVFGPTTKKYPFLLRAPFFLNKDSCAGPPKWIAEFNSPKACLVFSAVRVVCGDDTIECVQDDLFLHSTFQIAPWTCISAREHCSVRLYKRGQCRSSNVSRNFGRVLTILFQYASMGVTYLGQCPTKANLEFYLGQSYFV